MEDDSLIDAYLSMIPEDEDVQMVLNDQMIEEEK